jgi:hypothetical protein
VSLEITMGTTGSGKRSMLLVGSVSGAAHDRSLCLTMSIVYVWRLLLLLRCRCAGEGAIRIGWPNSSMESPRPEERWGALAGRLAGKRAAVTR